jgi:hypothetical protein
LPELRLVLSRGAGGIGAIASAIGGIIGLGDWVELPVYNCGTPAAVGQICVRMQGQISSAQEFFALGLVLMASALFLGPERDRLAFVLGEVLVIVTVLMLALWFVGGTFGAPP